jgi:hypothetical protein
VVLPPAAVTLCSEEVDADLPTSTLDRLEEHFIVQDMVGRDMTAEIELCNSTTNSKQCRIRLGYGELFRNDRYDECTTLALPSKATPIQAGSCDPVSDVAIALDQIFMCKKAVDYPSLPSRQSPKQAWLVLSKPLVHDDCPAPIVRCRQQ